MSPTTRNNLESVSENVYTRLLARIGTILASTVILPIGMWMAHRTLDNMDTMQDQIQTIVTTTAILQRQADQNTAELRDRYTGSQAARDLANQVQRDAQQDTDRARIERRVDIIEQR
jgi:hypothetical protein